MNDWWVGIPPAEVRVACAGETHVLRWERGHLVACQHGDLDDERAFVAIGGEAVPCIELAGAWQRHQDDLRVLAVGPRGSADELRLEAVRRSRHAAHPPASGTGVAVFAGRDYRQMAAAQGQAPSAEAEDLAEVITLAALGGGVGERLVATVAAEWAARRRRDDHRATDIDARLHAALYGRVSRALRAWLDEPGLRPRLQLVGEDDVRSLQRAGNVVRASLPFGWLVEVWARGLSVVDDRFCLAATPDGDRWALETVARDLGAPEQTAWQ
jgi:hypothetical protein